MWKPLGNKKEVGNCAIYVPLFSDHFLNYQYYPLEILYICSWMISEAASLREDVESLTKELAKANKVGLTAFWMHIIGFFIATCWFLCRQSAKARRLRFVLCIAVAISNPLLYDEAKSETAEFMFYRKWSNLWQKMSLCRGSFLARRTSSDCRTRLLCRSCSRYTKLCQPEWLLFGVLSLITYCLSF